MNKNVSKLINKVSIQDKEYPQSIKDLKNAPENLYFIGDLSSLKFSNSISVVGARQATLYSKHLLRSMVHRLSTFNSDLNIVSGAALGIDQEAHFSALENNIPTTLVLGSGFYESHLDLNSFFVRSLLKNPKNLLISEFEPNFKAQKWTFAYRNRIIAALSPLTIVVQAAEKSGSLITAKYATKLDRTVYAFANDLDNSIYSGNKHLIESGKAVALKSVSELCNKLGYQSPKTIETKNKSNKHKLASSLAEEIMKLLESGSKNFDYIKESVKGNEIGISSTLSLMEVKGLVRRDIGSCFTLAQKSY